MSSTLSSSTTLVNVAPDAEQKLVRVLASSSSSPPPANFVSDCENAISQGDAALLLDKIINTDSAVGSLLSLPDDEAVSAVSLLGALLNRVNDNARSESLLESLSSSIVRHGAAATSGGGDNAKKQITLLATLYNIRSDSTDKVKLLIKMVDVASSTAPEMIAPKTSKTSVLSKYVVDPSYVQTMFEEWNISPHVRRQFYKAAANAANIIKAPTISQRHTLLQVQTYTSAADCNSDECVGTATTAAIGAIRDPISLFGLQRNMLSFPAIQALEGKSGPVFALLKVFQEGNLKDYNSYLQSNGGEGVLAQLNLSPEDCSKNMRILSLCSLASEHDEIPYSAIATKLDVSPADVEKWVITAVSSGLLSAKMDQMEQSVLVERCVVRKCNIEQWRALQSRLHVWKNNVGDVLKQAMKAQQQRQTQSVQ